MWIRDSHEGVKVLDPTLLISADDYKGLIKDKDYAHKAYVAAYILDSSKDKTAILAEVSSHLNLPIQSLLEDPHGAKMLTVSQWLAAFDSADFVVTDSFHGCVFSIIFHKPFIAIANEFRGLDRFISLLRDAGLEKRLVFSSEEFEMRKDSLFTVCLLYTSLQGDNRRREKYSFALIYILRQCLYAGISRQSHPAALLLCLPGKVRTERKRCDAGGLLGYWEDSSRVG